MGIERTNSEKLKAESGYLLQEFLGLAAFGANPPRAVLAGFFVVGAGDAEQIRIAFQAAHDEVAKGTVRRRVGGW